MVWWNGEVTFEELKTAADKALMLEEPSPLEGMRMFSKWIAHSYYSDDMDISGIISTFGRLELSDEQIRAYEAPYPSGKYKAGAHVMAYFIPTQYPRMRNTGKMFMKNGINLFLWRLEATNE